jgi:hypothetical protein
MEKLNQEEPLHEITMFSYVQENKIKQTICMG